MEGVWSRATALIVKLDSVRVTYTEVGFYLTEGICFCPQMSLHRCDVLLSAEQVDAGLTFWLMLQLTDPDDESKQLTEWVNVGRVRPALEDDSQTVPIFQRSCGGF